MSVNSKLKATKIIGRKKAFHRQRIPRSSPQSTMSRRSDSSSEANSSCCADQMPDHTESRE